MNNIYGHNGSISSQNLCYELATKQKRVKESSRLTYLKEDIDQLYANMTKGAFVYSSVNGWKKARKIQATFLLYKKTKLQLINIISLLKLIIPQILTLQI